MRDQEPIKAFFNDARWGPASGSQGCWMGQLGVERKKFTIWDEAKKMSDLFPAQFGLLGRLRSENLREHLPLFEPEARPPAARGAASKKKCRVP